MKKAIIASAVALLAMSSIAAHAKPLPKPGNGSVVVVPVFSVGNVTTGNVVLNGDTTGNIYIGATDPIDDQYMDGEKESFYGAITVGSTTQAINYHSLNKPGVDGPDPIIDTAKELVFFNVGTQYTPTFTSTVERPDLDLDIKMGGLAGVLGLGVAGFYQQVSISSGDNATEDNGPL